MKIVVTVPAYNEEATIAAVIKDIKETMNRNRYNYLVLVVDDGSRDRTKEAAKKAGAIVYSHPKNLGLAETFRSEVKKCIELNADIIVHTDADGQYRAEDIPKLIKEIQKGNDLVLGSRFLGKIEEMPLIKRMGNRAFSKVISNITGQKISDGQTGFRAFTREFAEKVRIISDHTYTQEQIITGIKNKFKVSEVPIYFGRRKAGKSRLMKNPFEYAAKAWLNIFRVYRDNEPIRFFGFFGTVFMIIAALAGLVLLGKFIYLGYPNGFWDERLPKLVLIAIVFIAGIQILFFGMLADMIKEIRRK